MLAGFVVRLWSVLLAVVVASLTGSPPASADEQTHVVAKGQTLGGIAKRYGVTVAAIRNANDLRRGAHLRPGQELLIPDENDEEGAQAKTHRRRHDDDRGNPALQSFSLPSGPVYYYEPTGPGHLGMRPVLLYLHGRGGNPEADCKRWASVARPLGWMVCPSGPNPHGDGRDWGNNWVSARNVAMGAIDGLRAKYGRRIQLYGNTLIGFSEGAFVAMNIGVREPHTFNRWLILAASERYWGGAGVEELKSNRARVRRVYLITGEHDGVVDDTRQVREWLRKYDVTTQITVPGGIGHELALEDKPELYRMALVWLQSGSSGHSKKKKTST